MPPGASGTPKSVIALTYRSIVRRSNSVCSVIIECARRRFSCCARTSGWADAAPCLPPARSGHPPPQRSTPPVATHRSRPLFCCFVRHRSFDAKCSQFGVVAGTVDTDSVKGQISSLGRMLIKALEVRQHSCARALFMLRYGSKRRVIVGRITVVTSPLPSHACRSSKPSTIRCRAPSCCTGRRWAAASAR